MRKRWTVLVLCVLLTLSLFTGCAQQGSGVSLSVSVGSTVYDPASDRDFRSVFLRADEAMYRNKNEYYRLHRELDRR